MSVTVTVAKPLVGHGQALPNIQITLNEHVAC